MFRISNPTEDPDPADFPGLQLMAFQSEICPDTGTPHIQGYMEFVSNKRRTTLSRLFLDDGVELQTRMPNSNRKACVTYCTKVASREAGTTSTYWPDMVTVATMCDAPVRQGQGKRNDLVDYVAAITSGKKMYELLEEFPSCTLRYGNQHRNTVLMHLNSRPQPRIEHPKNCLVLWGESGVGKSYRVERDYPEGDEWFYAAPAQGGKAWFDGYEGQPGIVFDEMRDYWFPWHIVLRLLEFSQKKRVQVKGSTVYYKAHKFVITTNIHPKKWYKRMKDTPNSPWITSPLRKRISRIEHLTEVYVDPNGVRADDCHDSSEPSTSEEEAGFVGQDGVYRRN